jgi:hypothetical protein
VRQLRHSSFLTCKLVTAATAAWLTLALVQGTAPASGSPNHGYRLLAGDGGVFAFSSAFAGSAASDPTRCPANPPGRSMPHGSCWSIAATVDGGGYYVLNAYNGSIWTYGDAVSFGQPAGSGPYAGPADLWPTAVALATTPDCEGYWVLEVGLSGLGSVQGFGDAHFHGDETSVGAAHNGTPVGIVSSPDGGGYLVVDSDGGVFAFGDARFEGSMGGRQLNARVVGVAPTTDGAGYWLAAADGGVFAFGDASFAGSMGGTHLAAPVVGILADTTSQGYWLAAADGGVFALGGAPFEGSMGGRPLAQPVYALTS